MIKGALIDLLSYQIAHYYRYYIHSSPAHQSNNPGMLKHCGKMPLNEFNVVEFSSPQQGWRALHRSLNLKINRNVSIFRVADCKTTLTRMIIEALSHKDIIVTSLTGVRDIIENVELYRPANRFHE